MDSQLTFRVPKEMAEKLQEMADSAGLKKSDIARLALQGFIAQEEAADYSPSGSRPYDRIKHLIGSLDSGIPDLASRHREHLQRIFDEERDRMMGREIGEEGRD